MPRKRKQRGCCKKKRRRPATRQSGRGRFRGALKALGFKFGKSNQAGSGSVQRYLQKVLGRRPKRRRRWTRV